MHLKITKEYKENTSQYVNEYINQTDSGNYLIQVQAEFDLSSPLQANSMAGLNLSNPQSEPNHPLLLCQACWCAALVRSSSYLKLEGVGPQACPADWGRWKEKGTERGVQNWAGASTWDVNVPNRGAAELYVGAVGSEWRGVFVCEGGGGWSVRVIHLITHLLSHWTADCLFPHQPKSGIKTFDLCLCVGLLSHLQRHILIVMFKNIMK